MKKLNMEEIELLRRQGLLADIRNKLGNLSNIQQLIDLYFMSGQTQKKKADIGALLKKEGENIEASVDHILAILEYISNLPKEEIEKTIKGESQIKRDEIKEKNST